MIVVKWKDNQVVSIASTVHRIEPVSSTGRYSRQERKQIQVPIPRVFLEYKKSMGGTDQMDGNIAKYRIGVRGKKWWWSLFTWLIDVSINNAWILMRNCGSTITELDSRREIVETYLTTYRCLPRGGGRPSTSKSGGHVLKSTRYDRIDHFVQAVPFKKRKRCAEETCNSIGRTMCSKCKVGLCIDCFESYHTEQ